MNNQDNINGFLDSMDDFENVPAEQAPSAKSVPFTPAAVWPGEEQTAPQQVAAPPVQAETAQPEVPKTTTISASLSISGTRDIKSLSHFSSVGVFCLAMRVPPMP